MEAMQESAYRRPYGSRYRFDPREEEMMMREGMGGLTPIQVPEARGYSAALDSFLAQGGSRFLKSGLFKKGKLKGKSLSEAQAEFERLWASAPDSVKNKYAGMRSNDGMLAPSERQALTPVQPAMEGKTPQERRMAHYGFEFDANGNAVRIGSQKGRKADPSDKDGNKIPDMIQRPAEQVTTVQEAPQPGGDLSQQAMGTPEQQAAIAAMVQQGGEFATAGRGNDVADQAVVAAAKQAEAQADAQATAARAAQINAAKTQPRVASPQPPTRIGQPAVAMAKPPITPASTQIQSPAGNANALDRQFPGIAPMEGRQPATQPRVGPPKPASLTPMRQQNIQLAGGDMTKLPTDDRMAVQGKTNAQGVPAVKAPASPLQSAAQASKQPRINSLTGLAFGAMPGEMTGLNDAQKANATKLAAERAAQGTPTATPQEIAGAQRTMVNAGASMPTALRPITPVQRPTALQQSAINRPRVSPPGTNTVEGRAADEMRRQAAINANPGTVNPPGLMLGARKPLTQLIAPPPKAIPVKRTVLPRV